MSTYTPLTEQQFDHCICLMKQKNKEGLKIVYEAYLPYIYHIIFEILHNKENTEDVAADFFIKLWEKCGDYKPGGGHRAWLARIAHNMAIDYLRKSRRENLTEELPEPEPVQETPETIVVEDVSLKDALKSLKDSEREIVHLKIMGELTFQEIAKVLKVPMGTVTWRYKEAMRKLRSYGYEEKL